jgi:hypothetical protein
MGCHTPLALLQSNTHSNRAQKQCKGQALQCKERSHTSGGRWQPAAAWALVAMELELVIRASVVGGSRSFGATSIVGVGGDGGGALSTRSQFQKNRKAEVRDGGCAVDDASYGDKKIRVVLHPFNIYYIRSFLLIDS